jgi:hypothetical protein
MRGIDQRPPPAIRHRARLRPPLHHFLQIREAIAQKSGSVASGERVITTRSVLRHDSRTTHESGSHISAIHHEPGVLNYRQIHMPAPDSFYNRPTDQINSRRAPGVEKQIALGILSQIPLCVLDDASASIRESLELLKIAVRYICALGT